MADVEQMFYQVLVPVVPSSCNFLRYLWWPGGFMFLGVSPLRAVPALP